MLSSATASAGAHPRARKPKVRAGQCWMCRGTQGTQPWHCKQNVKNVPRAFGCAGIIPRGRFPTGAHSVLLSSEGFEGGGLPVLGSVRVAPVLPRAVSPSEWLLIRLAIKVGQ